MSALPPVPPTTSSFFRVSSNLVTPLVCQATQTLTSLFALPIQLNLVESKLAPGMPNSESNAIPRATVPMTVPSFGATL